jgi:hypothetical protein
LDLVNSAHEAFYGDCPATSFSIDSSSIANTSTLLSGNKPCPFVLVGYFHVLSDKEFYLAFTKERSDIASSFGC